MRGCRIGVVGLGYVGLPLAVEFGKHFDTVGFDIKTESFTAPPCSFVFGPSSPWPPGPNDYYGLG